MNWKNISKETSKAFLFAVLIVLISAIGVIKFAQKDNDDSSDKELQVQVEILQDKTDGEFVTASFEGSGVNLSLEIAASSPAKAKGLMFRDSLDELSGMIFTYEHEDDMTFWMKNTLIPLDIIFLDSKLRIINIHKNTKTEQISETYPSKSPAMYAVELNAYQADKLGIKEGDKLQIIHK